MDTINKKKTKKRIDQVEEHVLILLTKYPNYFLFLEGTLMLLWITS